MGDRDINRHGYHATHDTMANIDLDCGTALAAIAIEAVARLATPRKRHKAKGAAAMVDSCRWAADRRQRGRPSRLRQLLENPRECYQGVTQAESAGPALRLWLR